MILGVTGKTGSGKHTAAKYLEEKGWVVLDADTIAHELYRPHAPVWCEIVRVFSEAILKPDQTIDRKKLHDLVFDPSDPKTSEENLKKLNFLVHPALRTELTRQVAELRQRGKNGVIVAALWKELDLGSLVDHLIVIEADPAVACARIMVRDGISRETFFERFQSQKSPDNSCIIDNNGSLDDFFQRIDKFFKNI